jgi:hypothetical protein
MTMNHDIMHVFWYNLTIFQVHHETQTFSKQIFFH